MSGDKKPKICPASDVQDTGDGEIGTPSATASIPPLAGGPELHSSTDFKLGPMAQPPYQGHQKILHKVMSDTVSVSGEPTQLDGTCTLAKNDIFQDGPVDREQHMSTEWTQAPMPQQQFRPYLHPQMTGTFPMTDQGDQYPDGFSTGQECSPYQKYQLPNPMMPHGQVTIVQQIIDKANVYEAKDVQVPSYQIGESPLNNIKESTKAFIKSYDMSSHVSTFVERSALRMMKGLYFNGSLFIKGRHGTGKTRLGVHLLAKLSKESKRTPLVLTSALDWHLIPKTKSHTEKGQRKFIVMIDDMFGTSHLSKAALDEWEKLFDLMWPTVESGQICLIVTSQTDIFSKCKCRVSKYKLMKRMTMLDLDGKYALRPKEKTKLFLKQCGRLNLKKEEIQEIVDTNTCVGFPRCCELFSKRVKVKKGTSYGYAYDFLTTDVSMLKDNDQLGYLVLLLILMKGSLDAKMLDNPPRELKNLIDDLSDTCISLDRVPNCRSIKDKANELSGTYLKKRKNIFEFEHIAISDFVFLDAAKTHLKMFLDECSVDVLVKFVRVARSDISPNEDESLVNIECDLHEEFIERIINILLDDGVLKILEHPCFSDITFIDSIVDNNDNIALKLAIKDIGGGSCYCNIFNQEIFEEVTADSIDRICETSDIFREDKLFTYGHLLSFVIMKELLQFANSVLFKQDLADLPSSLLNEALTCYIYRNNHESVLKLLSKGTQTSLDSIKALCCVPQADPHMVDTVFEKTQWRDIHDWTQLLSLAIQFGNIRVTKLLVDKMKSEEKNKNAFAKCLTQLLYQTSGFILQTECIAKDIDVLHLMNILLYTECSYDKDILLSVAAGHANADILKRLLEVTSICQDEEQVLFRYATLYGSVQCLEELLKGSVNVRFNRAVGKQKDTLLHCAARSPMDSLSKIKRLLQSDTAKEGLGVNVTDGQNNTPLHFAALRGNVDCVLELLDNGADVTCLNEAEVTPLHCAALSNSRECMQLICQSGQTLSNGIPLYELCFHEPTRTHILGCFNSHYTDLHAVVKTGNPKLVIENLKILLASKLSIDRTNSSGETCLFNACSVNNLEVLKVLCRGTESIHTTSRGRCLLHAAAAHGDLEMIEFLCEKGGDVRKTDNMGQTVVHAAAGSSLEAAEKLYYLIEEKHAPFLDADKTGRTPLFPAAEFGDREVVEYLLEKGIDQKRLDDAGKSALDVAAPSNRDVLRRLTSTE
ncbi:uncharacterized protein [Haliotis cracherodii]|uniref:uncharacterized protein n=1 Tax=Haliotis cracherodii TaxID=6455 RepID=UPI0039E80594